MSRSAGCTSPIPISSRFRLPEPVLNPPDEATWHNGGAHGYVDDPTLSATLASAA